MKRKVLLTMLCLAISVSIVACGTENTAEQQEVIATEQTTETETVEEQEYADFRRRCILWRAIQIGKS